MICYADLIPAILPPRRDIVPVCKAVARQFIREKGVGACDGVERGLERLCCVHIYMRGR